MCVCVYSERLNNLSLIQFPNSQFDSSGPHIKMTAADILDLAMKEHMHVTGVIHGRLDEDVFVGELLSG